jgi:hypothetical protein
VSLAALLLALTAVALSTYAIGIASGSNDTNGGASAVTPGGNTNGGGNPSARAATTSAPTRPTSAPSKTSPNELDPKASFTEAYSPMPQRLEIHPGPNYRHIDLDKPQIDAGIGDITFGNGAFRFDRGVSVATAKSADVQPSDCVELIRTAVLPADTSVPAGTPDLTLCIATSITSAKDEGINRKMVVLHVTGVATDDTVQVDLKAWNIPN